MEPMRLQLYTRVRLLNDDHAKHDRVFRKGAECTLVEERTLKSAGKRYTLEILDRRANGHWCEVGPEEIEPLDED